jgi:endonuclease/exonuclease/phosphatase family metal-dependent hydrolase
MATTLAAVATPPAAAAAPPAVDAAVVPSAQPSALRAADEGGFVVASFNLLGHDHTARGGRKASWPNGKPRLARTLRLLDAHGVGVVGLQEVHREQQALLAGPMGAGWSVYPGPAVDQRNKQNAVAWRTNAFQLVSARPVLMPYKRGKLVPKPLVLLRERATGREFWVMTVHNAPGRHGRAAAHRVRGLRAQIDLTNRLLDGSRTPFLMTGDMNDREAYFCPYTASRRMRAAAGGSTGRPCVPPSGKIARVDWIFGSRAVQFSRYRFDTTTQQRRISDHPLVSAHVAWR